MSTQVWRRVVVGVVLTLATIGLPAAAQAAPPVEASAVAIVDSRVVPPGGMYHPPKRSIFSGDNDFAGHGPKVTGRAILDRSGNMLFAKVCMHAIESRSDFTEMDGCSAAVVLFQAPAGQCIQQVTVIGEATLPLQWEQSFFYQDFDHSVDEFTDDGFVDLWQFTGDTNGNDLGETGVRIFTEPMSVTYAPC